MIMQCLEFGYDSVMIDGSELPLEENIRRTAEVVSRAHALGIAVEAELGYVPKLGQQEVTTSGLTDPEEAAWFVEATGVDMLAVAIGTAHGFYKHEPRIDFDRLSTIRERVEIPLVLHGGSGLSAEIWQESIRRGIAKINFATEIKDTFVRGVKAVLSGSDEIDLRKTFPQAMQNVTRLVASKMKICRMEN